MNYVLVIKDLLSGSICLPLTIYAADADALHDKIQHLNDWFPPTVRVVRAIPDPRNP